MQVSEAELSAYYPSDEDICTQLGAGMSLAKEHLSYRIMDGAGAFSLWDLLTTVRPRRASPFSADCVPLLRSVRLTAAGGAAVPAAVPEALYTADLSIEASMPRYDCECSASFHP
jgi:hypothetical protein